MARVTSRQPSLPLPPRAWGYVRVSTEMQATITIAFSAPVDEATLRLNPSGL